MKIWIRNAANRLTTWARLCSASLQKPDNAKNTVTSRTIFTWLCSVCLPELDNAINAVTRSRTIFTWLCSGRCPSKPNNTINTMKTFNTIFTSLYSWHFSQSRTTPNLISPKRVQRHKGSDKIEDNARSTLLRTVSLKTNQRQKYGDKVQHNTHQTQFNDRMLCLPESPRGLTFTWWGCYGLCLT